MKTCCTQAKPCQAASYLDQRVQQTIEILTPALNPNNHVIPPKKDWLRLFMTLSLIMDYGENTPMQLNLKPITETQDLIEHPPHPRP